MPMQRMVLVLQPDGEQEQGLEALLAAQQDRNSPLFHQWLSAEEFGRRFGISENDLSQVVGWLTDMGFAVEPVAESRRQVVFSGTAAQIEAAFQTEIHAYRVNGVIHHANATDLAIPAALAPAISGVLSVHDFYSKPMHARIAPAAPAPEFTGGSGTHYLTPGDFTTIYNLGPLYGSSTNGTGQSIAIVARSNLKPADIAGFRTSFGLVANDPTVIVNGADPGVLSTGEQGEVELDTEWSGAIAPNASIQVVVSASSSTTDGVALSAQYIVNHNLAPVVSVSFGDCESDLGRAGNQFWNSLWQQAAAQGMSVFVASGDSGAAGCDDPSATSGTSADVNGLCSSPYATCVGGTQFNDTNNPAQYWSSSNTVNRVSAVSYIPESAWNESGTAGGSALWASGGGPSHVYSKPSWQSGKGVPADGHRDVPDVSLAAATHDGYLFNMNGSFYAGSGTSLATPSFAGLMALIVGRQGARQGSANAQFYTLAGNQGHGGPAVFHDVGSGNNSVPSITGYFAGAGYDLVTGLGSVDGNVLVNAWNGGSAPPPAPEPPAQCSYLLSGTGVNIDATAQNVAVMLTASSGNCAWTVTSDSDWLAVTSAALTNGSQMVAAAVAPNPSALPRMGTLTIAGLSFTVTQAGLSCTYAVRTGSLRANGGGFSQTVFVSAPSGCGWTATSHEVWVVITSGASGSGNGTVTFEVAANAGGPRVGALTVAGLSLRVTEGARSRLGVAHPGIPRPIAQPGPSY